MNGEHFREYIEIICLSTHSSKADIARYLEVTPELVWGTWQKTGLPRTKYSLVIARLKEYVRRVDYDNGCL
jgi:hypothetical protein